MRVGVFDSGIGGLTVLNCLIKNYPNKEYVYFGDTLNLPYGTKEINELRKCAFNIIDFFISKNVDLIVIACGTVSSNLYNEIKNKYNIPVIDVLSPTIRYIKENHLSSVGLLATPMTIKSEAFSEYVDDAIACPLFVPLIENGKIDSKECDEAVKTYLNNLKGCKNIILGCTHYPLLSNIINKYSDAKLINMGECVCEYLDLENSGNLKIDLYFSLLSDRLLDNISNMLDVPYEIKEHRL